MICVYAADCTDFSTNGLGLVTPQSCTVTETLNGEYELTLVHPLDENGKWMRLVEGCILRAPVPAAMTPQMNLVELSSGTLIYKVISPNGGRLNLRTGPSTSYKSLGLYRKNTEIIVLNNSNPTWFEVTCPDGKHGYMHTDYLEYVRTEDALSSATNQIVEPQQLRDQPFRIYRVVPDLNKITVHARHIFYDMMDNMVQKYEPHATATGAAVALTLPTKCMSEHEFTFYSDLDSTAEGVSFKNVNPVEAILGDEGVIHHYKGELVRDWFDVYLVKRVGADTNVQIREKKNLLGITYDVDISSVTTRIMPTGQDKDGEVLYLPELYLDSPLIGSYPSPKWIHLDVSTAKEVAKGDDKKTKDQCYQEMRKAAQAEFDAGCDLPSVTLKVDFINCANTVEYAQYKALQNIYLGDAVSVIAPRIGIAVSMRMTQYTYDCLLKKYTAMTLGTAADTLEGSVISARQLVSGSITGTKLAMNSVGIGQLQAGSVGALQVQMAAIGTAHIQDAAITQAHIAQALIETLNANAITAVSAKIKELAAGQITTDELYASIAMISVAQLTTANIINANIKWAQIENLAAEIATISKAQITSANIDEANIDWAAITTLTASVASIVKSEIGSADIDWAHIKDLATDTAIITQGTAGKLYISRLAVTEANMVSLTVGELVVKGADGHFYAISVGEDGNVVTTLKQVSNDDVADLSINAGEKIIEGSITAKTLNVQEIFGDNAVIRSLIAANIDVDTLFAREATLNAINAMDITSNTYLKLMVGGLEKRLSTAELKITKDAIVSTVTSSETYTNDLAAVQSAANSAQNAVDNLQVGGRNLLLDSGDEVSIQAKAAMPDISAYGQTLLANAETTVVISFDAKADVPTAVDHYPRTASGAVTKYAQSTTISTEWARYSQVYTLPADAYIEFAIRSNDKVVGGSNTATVTLRNIKLEVGNCATDWTAAPEEMEVRMETAESSITQNAGQIALKVSTSTYNTEKVYRGSTAPTTLYTNMLWLDTSVTPNLLKRYNGSAWVVAGAQEVKSSGLYIGSNNVAITTENFLLQLLDPNDNENVLMEMSADGNVGFKQLYADEVVSDSVAQAYAGYKWLWVEPSIETPTTSDFRSLGEAVETVNNRFLKDNVTIYLPYGIETYEPEGVVIQGISGPGKLTIYGYNDNSILNSYIRVQGCFANVCFQNVHLRESRSLNGTSRQPYLVEVTNCHFVEFNGCTLDANSIAYDSVYARASHVFLTGCGLYNALQGLECYLATGNMKNCCGSCNWAMMSYASVIFASGTVPGGSKGTGENGQLFATGVTIDYGTAIPTVVPDSSSVMYASTTKTWRGSWRTDTLDVIQGVYSASGYSSSLSWNRGCMWFSTAKTLLSGHTVKSATLTLHRETGAGSGSAKSVYLCAITNTSASGTPSIAKNFGAIGTIGRGKQVTFAIPTEAVQGLANGTYGGLCLYETPYNFGSSTYSSCYMRMSGTDSDTEPYIRCVFSGGTGDG